jgi:hypothetical protein
MNKDNENKFKMNRTVVTTSSFEEADDHVNYWEDKTPMERLNAACFIINNIYSVTASTPVQKHLVDARKHSDG